MGRGQNRFSDADRQKTISYSCSTPQKTCSVMWCKRVALKINSLFLSIEARANGICMLEALMIRYNGTCTKTTKLMKNLDSTISAVEAKILEILGFQNGGKRVAPVGQECGTCGGKSVAHTTS